MHLPQNRYYKPLLASLLLLGVLLTSGCGGFFRLYRLDEVPGKIKKILAKEYNLTSYVYRSGKTIWIYTPLPFSFITISVRDNARLKDIINNVLATTARVLWSTEKGIEFYVALFPDTTSGMVIYIIGTTEDLKSFYFEKISIDEYSRRKIFDRTYVPAVIGDTTGTKFHYFDISKPNFLAELITQRIKYKKTEKQKNPPYQGIDIKWGTQETTDGNYIFVFSTDKGPPGLEKDLIQEIKDVLQGYDFRKIKRIDIILPSHTISLLKDDIFEKQ